MDEKTTVKVIELIHQIDKLLEEGMRLPGFMILRRKYLSKKKKDKYAIFLFGFKHFILVQCSRGGRPEFIELPYKELPKVAQKYAEEGYNLWKVGSPYSLRDDAEI